MPLSIPTELSKITPFIRRAEELDLSRTTKPEARVVAYYSRQYAAQIGIPLLSSAATSPNASAIKACLTGILSDLETEKTAMDNFTRAEAEFLCRKFAMMIFDKADVEDQTGTANKNTARTFYAAATFIQILEQFYADIAQGGDEGSSTAAEDKKKILYAKWKAIEITKAVKEGRTPTPGGYDSQQDYGAEDGSDEAEQPTKSTAATVETISDDDSDEKVNSVDPPDIPMAPMNKLPPPVQQQQPFVQPSKFLPSPEASDNEDDKEAGIEVSLDGDTADVLPPPPSYNHAVPKPSRPPVSFDLPPAQPLPEASAPPSNSSGFSSLFGLGKAKGKKQISKSDLSDAIELTRFALVALEDKDTELGADRLQQALSKLLHR
jgi:vacuolar protein sorting-associated protein VTA1